MIRYSKHFVKKQNVFCIFVFFYNILLFWVQHSSVIPCFSKKWKHLFSTNIHTKNVNFLWNLRILSIVFTPVFKKSYFLFFQQNSVFLAKTTKYTQYFVVSIKKKPNHLAVSSQNTSSRCNFQGKRTNRDHPNPSQFVRASPQNWRIWIN